VAQRAGDWFYDERDPLKPFFLNVNFVNPHDKQWFWGGMQKTEYDKVYSYFPDEVPPQDYEHDFPNEAYPQIQGYPAQAEIRTLLDN